MTGHAPYQLSVLFASLVGASGFVLAIQAWIKFRGSPFGRTLAILPVFMLILAVYHPVLLVFPEHLELALALESVGYVLLLVFAGEMIRVHRRLNRVEG